MKELFPLGIAMRVTFWLHINFWQIMKDDSGITMKSRNLFARNMTIHTTISTV